MKQQIRLLFILLIFVGCSQAPTKKDVYHPIPEPMRVFLTSPMRSPVVSIRSRDGSACSGTLVAPQVILTAAHCVNFFHGSLSDIIIQVPQIGTVAASEVKLHPAYSGRQNGVDLALIKILTSAKKDVMLPKIAATELDEQAEFITVGFGETGIRDEQRPRTGILFFERTLPAIGSNDEEIDHGLIKLVPQSGEKFAGESGSPAISDDKIVAIQTMTYYRGPTYDVESPDYSLFVSLFPFQDWFFQTLRALSTPGACRETGQSFQSSAGGCEQVTQGKVWSAPSERPLSYLEAKKYCDRLEEGSQSDWRLPSRAELEGLAQEPGIENLRFNSQYWTLTIKERPESLLVISLPSGKSAPASFFAMKDTLCVREIAQKNDL